MAITHRIQSSTFVQTKTKTPMTTSALSAKLSAILKSVLNAGKKMETDDSSTPAGPDTTKFRAMRSGKVELVNGLTVPTGYSTMRFDQFLKIGGGIPYEQSTKLYEAVSKKVGQLAEQVGTESTHIKCTDGTVSVLRLDGTNWGGIGFRVSKGV